MRSRVASWFSNADAADATSISFVSHAVNLSSEDQANVFADTLVHHQHATNTPVRLVIFDTLARCAVGADENSSQEMGVVVDHLDRVRRRISASSGEGCTAMVVHHSSKSAPAVMRGSSAVLGAMDTAIALLAVGNGEVELRVTKQKEGPDDGVSLRLVEAMGSMVVSSISAFPPQKRGRS
jgi:RecA-family ATPase